MKILYFLLFSLCIGTASARIDVSSVQQIVTDSETKLREDLLSLPFEYRQYVFPAILETKNLSQETLSHPEIAPWRGKKPTRIAPQIQAFADKNLDVLSPRLYPLLMPEVWDLTTKKDVKKKDDFELNINNLNNTYPSLDERGIFPRQPRPAAVGDLTQNNVQSIIDGLATFKTIDEETERQLMRAVNPTDVSNAMRKPCASIVNRLYAIGQNELVDKVLARVKMDKETFSQKCDRTINAFRVLNTPPATIRYARLLPTLPPSHDPIVAEARQTLTMLFQTSYADADSVKPFIKQLDSLLRPRYIFLGTPLLLDF